MKTKGKVQIRSLGGLVDAPLYYKWEQEILGAKLQFALHAAAGHAKGFQAPLAISELGTGFDVQAVLLHPNSRHPLTTNSVAGLTSTAVKKIARAAIHHLIYRRVGAMMFLDSIVGAQMQVAKIEAGPTYEGHPDQLPPNKVPMVLPSSPSCLACEDTKVLTTTDKDHEGQPIEVACTECIPGGEEYIPSPEEAATAMADADQMNRNLAKYGTIDSPPTTAADWASPTEEEWFETLNTEQKLAHLVHKRDQTLESLKTYQTRGVAKSEYDRIDQLDDELVALNQQIAELGAPCSK